MDDDEEDDLEDDLKDDEDELKDKGETVETVAESEACILADFPSRVWPSTRSLALSSGQMVSSSVSLPIK